MKQKKKPNVRGLFAGGIALAAQMATGAASSYVDAANYQFDPNADPYKFNPVKALQAGPLTLIPELIKMTKDKQQRSSHVSFASPGNYATGGTINAKEVRSYDANKLKAVQLDLKSRGLYKGKIDGLYGPLTEAAISGYNSKNSPKANVPYPVSSGNASTQDMNPNDFTYSEEEVKKYKDIYESRVKECKMGDHGCLAVANAYYNKYVAPKVGGASSWQELEAAGVTGGNKNTPGYGETVDAWDIHGVLQKMGGANKFPEATKTKLRAAIDTGDQKAINKVLKEMDIPIGAVVGYASSAMGHDQSKSSNVAQGLAPSGHASRVIGYSEDGVPYTYDYGEIKPIGKGLYSVNELNNITVPKGAEDRTFSKMQGKLKTAGAKPISVNYSGKTKYDKGEFDPFLGALEGSKEEIMNKLDLTNEQYDKYAKQAAALALTETRGGDDAIMRKIPLTSAKGLAAAALTGGLSSQVGVPSYIMDKMGIGKSRGITQVTDSQLFDEKGNVKRKMDKLGMSKKGYDAWDPKQQAAATIAQLASNDTGTTAEGLSQDQVAAYKWNNPRTLRAGQAQGESQFAKRYMREMSDINVKEAAPVKFDFTKPKGFAAGGSMDEDNNPNDADDVLSNGAFQVKGSPGTTDGNYYPGLNVNLDHNEVVKKNFVYSTKLKTPGGKPFSYEAAKIEKSTGKAQKILTTNPNDAMAKNTIKMNEGSMASLAKLQETMAAQMGLRQGQPQGMVYGGFNDGPGDPPYSFITKNMGNDKLGLSNINSQDWIDYTNPVDVGTGKRRRPITPDYYVGTKLAPGQAAIDLGRDGMFYDPYQKQFSVRNSKGEYVGVQPNEGQFDVQGSTIKDLIGGKSYNVDEHLKYMSSPRMEAAGPGGPTLATPSNILYNPNDNTQGDPTLGSFPRPTTSPTPQPVVGGYNPSKGGSRGKGGSKPAGNTGATTSPLDFQDEYNISQYDAMKAKEQSDMRGAESAWENSSGYDQNPAEAGYDSNQAAMAGADARKAYEARQAPPQNPDEAAYDAMKAATGTGAGAGTAAGLAGMGEKFTIGDGLQALTVASKFGQLIGGPEKEKANYDTTKISREVFDVANPLYQSNRQFQQGLNTLRSGSINQGRAMANSLYAGKMNQDSEIRTKYDQLNQSAITQQEARQSDQRRYNIGQTVGTNDINARNRASYKEAIDTAFNSLGNLGKGLNEKKTSYDSLAVLQKMYPEVYARIMAERAKVKPT